MSLTTVAIRPALAADVSSMHDIYGYHVLHGTGSFEEEPPTLPVMQQRYEAREHDGYPTLMAEIDGRVAGFAYAGNYKPRSAYRFTVEDSIYVSPEAVGKGVGFTLLSELINVCSARNYQQMIAVIGDSANAASIGLHSRCGFAMVGTAKGLGYKHERWLDIVFMQRSLIATS